jgi:hypothetical protein
MRAFVEHSWLAQRRALSAGLLTGVALVAAVVLSRRVSGDASAFSSQLTACVVGLIGMAVGALSVLTLGVLGNVSQTQRFVAVSLSSLPGLILGLALLPSGSASGLVALLAIFGLTLGVSILCDSQLGLDSLATSRSSVRRESEVVDTNQTTPKPTQEELPPATDRVESIDCFETDLETRLMSQLDSIETDDAQSEQSPSAFRQPHPAENPNNVQWLSRMVESGMDTLEGVVSAELVSNERQLAVHIPFVPAFEVLPEFECEAVHGEPVDVHVTQIKTYGVRIELKRPKSEMQNPLTVQIGYFASAEVAAADLEMTHPKASARRA